MLKLVTAPVLSVPELVDLLPLHAPLALQLFALLTFHRSMVEPPLWKLVESAQKLRSGV